MPVAVPRRQHEATAEPPTAAFSSRLQRGTSTITVTRGSDAGVLGSPAAMYRAVTRSPRGGRWLARFDLPRAAEVRSAASQRGFRQPQLRTGFCGSPLNGHRRDSDRHRRHLAALAAVLVADRGGMPTRSLVPNLEG